MEPEPKVVSKKSKALDFNSETHKQITKLKTVEMASRLHEKTNTTAQQKEGIKRELEAAITTFKELPIEEQMKFKDDPTAEKVSDINVEPEKDGEEGEKIAKPVKKTKAQEKREKKAKEEEDRRIAKEEEDKLKPIVIQRTYKEELEFIEEVNPCCYKVKVGFVEGMHNDALIFVNKSLINQVLEELKHNCTDFKGPSGHGGFIPAIKQVANVGSLPGIVGSSMAMPDIHSGYGFAIGNIAAFDMDDPEAVVSPGGVGYDINCGVRLVRTNLTIDDIEGRTNELADALFRIIPVGVGSKSIFSATDSDLIEILDTGLDWSIKNGYAWENDKLHVEENGRMMNADSKSVSYRAMNRGRDQIGTLGSGNHYCEVQVVDEVFDEVSANKMGIGKVIKYCTPSQLQHYRKVVASEAVLVMEKQMAKDGVRVNDRQLSCGKIQSPEGQKYLKAMSAAANYAFVNRQILTHLVRKSFSEVFNKTPEDLDMNVVYDVSHNIAKMEKHIVEGVEKNLLIHRKGSTRAFPPFHPSIPEDYQEIGQPILIGGSMGTCSYVLTGTQKGMETTFGSTCHGAGRNLSRNESRREMTEKQVKQSLDAQGITIRVASPKLIMEEAPKSYKDVSSVIDTCHEAGISKKTVKLKPVIVIKG